MPTPADSVEEFKVNTANQTADFNSSSGAEIKVVTKRGTNSFHGTAYEYYKDNNWSGNTWQNSYNRLIIRSRNRRPSQLSLQPFWVRGWRASNPKRSSRRQNLFLFQL